jgi:predicted anti-sigma-YlaC factor YlaD
MRCSTCQEALSARLDGEPTGVSVDDLDTHLATCSDCRRFSLDVADVHRLVRVRRAEPVPDLTRSIIDATAEVAPTPARAGFGWIRYGLVVIGLTMLALALPSLLLHDSGNAIHMTRELSAWDAAFGAGLLFAAWHPTRARGLLPMASVLVGAQLLGSIIDIASGRSPVVSETHHALEIVGVLLLWLLCRSIGASRRSSIRAILRTA